MFAVLKAFNMLKHRYEFEIDSVMTDNGAQFGSGRNAKKIKTSIHLRDY